MEPKIENREPRKRHELAFKRDCVAPLEKTTFVRLGALSRRG